MNKRKNINTDTNGKETSNIPVKNSVVYLERSSIHRQSKGECCYLSFWNPHDRDFGSFLPLVCDIIELLSSSYTVLVSVHFYPWVFRDKLLCGFKKTQGWIDGDADKVLDFLLLNPNPCCRFWRKTYKKDECTLRKLNVVYSNVSADYFRSSFIETQTENGKDMNTQTIINLCGQPLSCVTPESFESIEPKITINHDLTHTMFYAELFGVEAQKLFVEAVEKAAEKNNLKPEVTL